MAATAAVASSNSKGSIPSSKAINTCAASGSTEATSVGSATTEPHASTSGANTSGVKENSLPSAIVNAGVFSPPNTTRAPFSVMIVADSGIAMPG